MDLPIILIGPMATGKTTIARLLAQKLSLVQHELDDKRWDYYNEIGYDQALADQIRMEKGFSALARDYWQSRRQFSVNLVAPAEAVRRAMASPGRPSKPDIK